MAKIKLVQRVKYASDIHEKLIELGWDLDTAALFCDDLPDAKVEPVRHGTWKPCFEDWRKQIEGDKCSACGFEHYGCSIRVYHYCPNCGARMDLGGADNG